MDATEKIPIIEEVLSVETRSVVSGRVRVETRTALVEEMARADLESSEVEVLRVPVNRQVDQAPSIRTEGDVTIIPVMEEVLVVEKRLVLKEELHIKRRVFTEAVEMPVTLRKQQAVITRESNETPTPTDEE